MKVITAIGNPKINEELKPCGQIYITKEILAIFEEIIGKENVII